MSGSQRRDITLRGSKAERAEELKAAVEKECDFDLSWPEFVGELMRDYDGPEMQTAPSDRH